MGRGNIKPGVQGLLLYDGVVYFVPQYSAGARIRKARPTVKVSSADSPLNI